MNKLNKIQKVKRIIAFIILMSLLTSCSIRKPKFIDAPLYVPGDKDLALLNIGIRVK